MDEDTTMCPVYRFEFTNGTSRRSDELAVGDMEHPNAIIEQLADFAKSDPEATVTLVELVDKREL